MSTHVANILGGAEKRLRRLARRRAGREVKRDYIAAAALIRRLRSAK